jgi:hypothetical protein
MNFLKFKYIVFIITQLHHCPAIFITPHVFPKLTRIDMALLRLQYQHLAFLSDIYTVHYSACLLSIYLKGTVASRNLVIEVVA